MKDRKRQYPDNSLIFAQKALWRQRRATATFAEKLAALDDLRERIQPIVSAREERKNARLRKSVAHPTNNH
ncbi:hypothetical protein [Taklimakanibacter lacteus]|uniref:hypothetical protein n=1 Tax=Taklimakanibacter lacteus TaxID=2268456 RepID=UPI0013C3F276